MENDITSPNAINARAEKPCFLNQDLKLNSGRTARRSHHRDRKKKSNASIASYGTSAGRFDGWTADPSARCALFIQIRIGCLDSYERCRHSNALI